MTIRLDIALVIAAIALGWTHHPIGVFVCLGVLWVQKYG